MIQLEMKTIFSSDVELDVWQPVTDTDVCFLIEMEIGEIGKEGADQFSVMFATPDGLKNFGIGENVILDRGLIVLRRFSWPAVHASLERILRGCECADWIDVTDHLQRYFFWEYEEMRQTNGRLLEIRSTLHDADADVWIRDTGAVLYSVEIEVGVMDDSESALYAVTFATPEGLKHLNPQNKVVSDRGVIVVRQFSKPMVHKVLEEIVQKRTSNAPVFLQRYFKEGVSGSALLRRR